MGCTATNHSVWPGGDHSICACVKEYGLSVRSSLWPSGFYTMPSDTAAALQGPAVEFVRHRIETTSHQWETASYHKIGLLSLILDGACRSLLSSGNTLMEKS